MRTVSPMSSIGETPCRAAALSRLDAAWMLGAAQDDALLELEGEQDDRTVDEEEPLDGADDGGQEEDLDEKMRGSLSVGQRAFGNAEPPPTCLAVRIKGL